MNPRSKPKPILLGPTLDPKDPHPFLFSRLHLTLVAEFSRLPTDPGRYTADLLTALADRLGDQKVSGHFYRRKPVIIDRPGLLPVEHHADTFRVTLRDLAADPRLSSLGGDFASLFFDRQLGRKDTRRTALLLDWFGGRAPDSEHTLVLSLSIPDFLGHSGDSLMALTRRFFDLAAATGLCTYGLGDIADESESAEGSYYAFGPYQGGRSRFQRNLEAELWGAAKARRRNFVRGVFWANFLSPYHMERLGGLAALAEFRALVAAARSPEFGAGEAIEYPDGSALIILYPINEFIFMIERFPWFQGDVMLREARWLAIKLAQARLPIWFDEEGIPRATDGAGYTPPAAPPPPTDEEIAAYMAHMWANPPRCVAAVALRPTEKQIATLQLGEGRYTTMFHIAPRAEHAPLQVWGAPASNDNSGLASPILAGAPIRSLAPFVFDARTDGYNGEFGLTLNGSSKKRSRSFTCPKCNHDHFHLTALFQYSGNNEELTDPALIARRQDFFSGFTLRGRCAQCRRKVEIASVECS